MKGQVKADDTVLTPHRTFSYAESLYYLLHSGVMSQSEKEWVFGKALRQILRWDPAAQIR